MSSVLFLSVRIRLSMSIRGRMPNGLESLEKIYFAANSQSLEGLICNPWQEQSGMRRGIGHG